MGKDDSSVWEYLRIATPVLTTIGIFLISYVGNSLNTHMTDVQTQLGKIDDKLFKHLTNEEIHIPRSTIVNKAEFDLINQIRAAQIADLKADIGDVKMLIIRSSSGGFDAKSK